MFSGGIVDASAKNKKEKLQQKVKDCLESNQN
jgi:hypothetical protein